LRLPRDPRFTDERRLFVLRHTCEDCAFFVAPGDTSGGTCAHEWPTGPHRRAYYEPDPAAPADAEIVLCKEFELR
jgi:hypothetical protein